MKKIFAVLSILVLAMAFVSCEKEVINPGFVRDDNPPAEMFSNARDYGMFSSVYIEKGDVEKAVNFGNIETGSSEWYDDFGVLRKTVYMQVTYKVPAKKYFGLFQETTYISNSIDYYLISADELEVVKESITRKGFARVWLSGDNFNGFQWKRISGVE